MKKRVYHPKCSCSKRLVDGICPEGCNAYPKPATAVARSQKGAKLESRMGWLTPKDMDNGLMNVIKNSKLRPMHRMFND